MKIYVLKQFFHQIFFEIQIYFHKTVDVIENIIDLHDFPNFPNTAGKFEMHAQKLCASLSGTFSSAA